MKRIVAASFAALAMLLGLASQAISAQAASGQPASGQAGISQGALSRGIAFTDSAGTAIRLDGKAKRIVSLSPAITEDIYAAGAGSALVGDTTYCNFPSDAVSKPKIGGFSAKTISVETVLSLKPDLVIGELRTHGALAAQMARSGIAVAVFSLNGFDDIYAAILRLGEIAGDPVVAAKSVSTMKTRLEAVAARTAKVPAAERPLVFWETWDDPLMSSGPSTFTGMLVELAGGRNIFADAKQEWPVVSFEEIVKRNPDIIMSSDSHGDRVTMDRLAARPGWKGLAAVKSKRVFLLNGDIVSRAGPRLADAAELMAKVMDGFRTGK
jgi:iron complex transport system substrate-binding protein